MEKKFFCVKGSFIMSKVSVKKTWKNFEKKNRRNEVNEFLNTPTANSSHRYVKRAANCNFTLI